MVNEETFILSKEAFEEKSIRKLFLDFLSRKIQNFNEINQTQYTINCFEGYITKNHYIIFNYDDLVRKIIFKNKPLRFFIEDDDKVLLNYLEREYNSWK